MALGLGLPVITTVQAIPVTIGMHAVKIEISHWTGGIVNGIPKLQGNICEYIDCPPNVV